MVFYRGEWCPYCNKNLKRLEDSLQLIKDKGATLIAVTPEQPESIAKTIEKTAIINMAANDGRKAHSGRKDQCASILLLPL